MFGNSKFLLRKVLYRQEEKPGTEPSGIDEKPGVPASVGSGETPVEASADKGEEFDLERAMKTIRALRDEVKAAKNTAKEAQAKIERETLSETERLKKDLTDANAKLAEAEKAQKKSSVVVEAAKRGFNDPEDAWNMLAVSDIDGSEQIVAALADLAKRKPYLLKAAGNAAPPATPIAPKTPVGNPARHTLTLEAVKQMTPDQVAANWKEVESLLSGGQ